MPPQAGSTPATTAPEAPASIADRLSQLMQLAGAHEAAGRLDEAEAVLRHVLSEAPLHHPALHLLGIVHFKKDQRADAARLIEQSIALAPTIALYHRNIGEIYRLLGWLD
jgi:Flp pilus assembly protein TadD